MSWFAGIVPILAHYSMGVLGIGGLCLLAVFADVIVAWPPLKVLGLADVGHRVRNIALIAAAAVALSLFSYGVGVSNEADRCKVQFAAAKGTAIKRGADAHDRASDDASRGVRDDQDTDK